MLTWKIFVATEVITARPITTATANTAVVTVAAADIADAESKRNSKVVTELQLGIWN